MKKKAHQIIAGYAPGDAISEEARNIRSLLNQWGFESQIYCPPKHIHQDCIWDCRPIEDFPTKGTDLLIHHFSIGSVATPYALEFGGPKVMIYHNITPAKFHRPFNLEIAQRLESGRDELRAFSAVYDLSLGDSEFNRRELEEAGYRNTGVLPILFDPKKMHQVPVLSRLSWRRNSGTTVFFVGRLVPNKKAETLIQAFNLYQKFYEPESQLVWVGSFGGFGLYYLALQEMIQKLDVKNVCLTGYVQHQKLLSWYRRGDVFVSTSEHEGFCVPILESFFFRKPVIALRAAAVPETVGNAGILIDEPDPLLFSEAIHQVVRDSDLKDFLVGSGEERLATVFGYEKTAALLREHLKPFW